LVISAKDADTLLIVLADADIEDVYCVSVLILIPELVFNSITTLLGKIVPTTVVTKLSPYELLGMPTVEIGAPCELVPIVSSVVIELPL
jgi:hypothetical protein